MQFKEKLYYLFRNSTFKDNFVELFLRQGMSAFFGFVLALLLTNITSFVVALIVFVLIVFILSILLSKNKHQFDIVEILKEEQRASNWIEIVRIGYPLSRPLWLSGRYMLRVEIGEIVKNAAEKIGGDITIGDSSYNSYFILASVLIDDLGWTKFVVGQDIKAERNIKEGVRIAKENKFWNLAIKGNRHLIGIISEKNCSEEIETIFKEIESLKENIIDVNEKNVIEAGLLFSRAEYLLKVDKLDEAMKLTLSAQKLFFDLADFERYSKTFDLQAQILIAKGPSNYTQAKTVISEGMAISAKWQRKERYIRLAILSMQLKTKIIELDKHYTKTEYFQDKENMDNLFQKASEIGEDIDNETFLLQLKKSYKHFCKCAKKTIKTRKGKE